MRFLFGDHVLDTARRELTRGGEQIAAEPQVFDLLVYLLQNRERVVSKDDLLASVWGGRIVSDATLDSRITAARRAVGDSAAAQTLIRTFARKGVRFVGEVREEAQSAALAPELTAELGRPELALPDKPSIAVLPFTNLSGHPEQEYFADGMVEEIITALSRIRWLFVLARNSSFTYKGQAIDVKQVGRDLGVRYVLEGSVRRGGNRVRIGAQLIEAETGAHLWADRFDGSLEDVFDLQDKVASSVAGVIEPALQAAETARSASRRTSDLGAYDLYLRAYAMYFARQMREALALLGHRPRRALRPCPWACGAMLPTSGHKHFRLRSGSDAAEGDRLWTPGRRSGEGRPWRSGERRNGARRSWRRHRWDDRAGRSRARLQSKLRARLAHQRFSQAVGRPSRSGDRACRDGLAPQPARAGGSYDVSDRFRPVLRPTFRGGRP